MGHNFMFLKESVLINNTNDITSNNKGSFLKASDWFEVPFFVLIEAWKLNTSWDEDALVSSNSDFFKWSLDTIENCSKIPGPSSTERGSPVLKIGSP
jgi:hypothetical protein